MMCPQGTASVLRATRGLLSQPMCILGPAARQQQHSRRGRLHRAAATPATAAPAGVAPPPDLAAGQAAADAALRASLMDAQMSWPSRSHSCGLLREGEAGVPVTVCGWVDRNRDMGGLVFLDVRDHTSLLQEGLLPVVSNCYMCYDTLLAGYKQDGISCVNLTVTR